MLKINIAKLFFLLIISSGLFFVLYSNTSLAFDFQSKSGIENTANKAGYYDANLADESMAKIIGKVVRQLIIYLGVFFLFLTIYGGLIWMFSRGNEQEVERAKKILQDAFIGLIIVLLAYAITYFFMATLSGV